MTHEMALKLAQTETPEQMADRIVELYETIDDLRTNAERWERAWQRVVEERDEWKRRAERLELSLTRSNESHEQLADTLERAVARVRELKQANSDFAAAAIEQPPYKADLEAERDDLRAKLAKARSALTWIAEHPNARFNVAVCHPKDPTIQQKVYATLAAIKEEVSA